MVTPDPAPEPGRSAWRRVLLGPEGLRAGWRIVAFFAIASALFLPAGALLRRLLRGFDEVGTYVLGEILVIAAMLAASAIMARFERRTIAEYGLPWRRMFGPRFWQGTAIGCLAITALAGGLKACGAFSYAIGALRGTEIATWGALYVVVFAIIGLKEEYQYRGYLLFTLASGIGFWPAAVASSVYFGINHLLFAGVSALGALNIALGGLFLSLLLRRSGNLWMAIGCHTALNWSEAFLYGVPVSGHTLPGHLLDARASGPDWLTGGPAGPEGSVVFTLVLVALWLVAYFWPRASAREQAA